MDYAYTFFPQTTHDKSLTQDFQYYNQERSSILDSEDVLYPSTFTSPLLDTMIPSPDSIYISHIDPMNQEYSMFYTQDPPVVNLERRSSLSSTLSSLSSTKSSLYHCEFKGCKKTFTRTYNLKSHHRTHTDEKPFVCQLCSKAFARQHDRNRHEKLHSGIRPYPCHFCHKSFARQDALNRHLKRDKKKNKSLDMFMAPPPCLLLKFKKRQLAKKKKANQKDDDLI